MTDAEADYRALSVSERIQLVEDIWDSILRDTPTPYPLAPDDLTELHRRLAEHRANPESAVPWEQVRVALFKDVD